MGVEVKSRSKYLETTGKEVVTSTGSESEPNVTTGPYSIPDDIWAVGNPALVVNGVTRPRIFSETLVPIMDQVIQNVSIIAATSSHPQIVLVGASDAQVQLIARLFSSDALSRSFVWEAALENPVTGGGPIIMMFGNNALSTSGAGATQWRMGTGSVLELPNRDGSPAGNLREIIHIIHETLHHALGGHENYTDAYSGFGPKVAAQMTLSELLDFRLYGFDVGTDYGRENLLAVYNISLDRVYDDTQTVTNQLNEWLIKEKLLDEQFDDESLPSQFGYAKAIVQKVQNIRIAGLAVWAKNNFVAEYAAGNITETQLDILHKAGILGKDDDTYVYRPNTTVQRYVLTEGGKDLGSFTLSPVQDTASHAIMFANNSFLLSAELSDISAASTQIAITAPRIDDSGDYTPAPDEIQSNVFGQIAAGFGQSLDLVSGGGSMEEHFASSGLVDSIDQLGHLGIGIVSSLLAVELSDALGFNGLHAQSFQAAAFSVINNTASTIFDNVLFNATNGPGQNVNIFKGVNLDAIGAFLGNTLSNVIVTPRTQAAVILNSIGANIGATIGSGLIPIPGVGAFVGAFVGGTIGTLLGNLFGKKKPKIPTADASTVLSFQDGYYQLGTVNSANSGNEDLVTDMALAAADTLNGLIDTMKAGDSNARVINTVSPTQVYGHDGNQIYVTLNGQRQNVDSPNQAVVDGILASIKETDIAGGSLYMKRAVANSTSEGFLAFGGDLLTANDYTLYQRNKALIDGAIAAPWESLSDSDKHWYTSNEAVILRIQREDQAALSAWDINWRNNNQARVDSVLGTLNSVSTFAAGWIITLQRASELGLNRSSVSDFYGGAKGFVDSLQGIVTQTIDYEDIAFKWVQGDSLQVHLDTNKDGLAHVNEEILFTLNNFSGALDANGSGVGYTTRSGRHTGAMSAASELMIFSPNHVYAAHAGAGNDIIIGRELNDSLYGDAGDDWLDGGSGNDRLYGGDGDDVLLGRAGNDVLYGGAGDDFLHSGSGTVNLNGDAGNDTLVMGGTGWARGGAGDDTYIISSLAGWRGFAYDGAGNNATNLGNDTVSYENVGWGLVIDMGETKAASWETSTWWFLPHADTALINARRNGGGSENIAVGYHKIENVTGTAFADIITGDDKNNTIRGGGGDDVLNGGGGVDVIEGGTGADRIERGRNDAGAWGVTTVSYEHSYGGVDVSIQVLDSLGGQHAFGGDASGDTFIGHMHHLTGSEYSDVLEGNHGSNVLKGLGGDDYFIVTRANDQYWGGEGFDTVDYGNHKGSSGLSIDARDGQRTYYFSDGVYDNAGYSRSWDVEHIVGTQHADTIRFGDGDNVLEGGKGNDVLYGGDGNDIYFVEVGGGNDTIVEYGGQGHDTIMVGYEVDLSWDDMWISDIGTNLRLTYRPQVGGAQHLATATHSPSEQRENVGIDAIDIGGTGGVDIWYLNGGVVAGTAWGNNNNNLIKGRSDAAGRSVLQGFDGNDTIYAAVTAGGYETNDNFLHGGRGNDTIYASVGDDQYIFDRGSGRDTIRDTGGLDHIQFGPGVGVNDLIFEVIGVDLYIGIVPEGTEDKSTLNASQMSDRIRLLNGGSVTEKVFLNKTLFSGNLVEYITVQNTNLDLRTLDINWDVTIDYSNPGDTAPGDPDGPSGPGEGGHIPPVMFDLDGDGLELVSVDESHVVIKGGDKSLTRIGWLGGDDGFLALDRNGDGKITDMTEISFVQDLEDATTDMEGLVAYDTNEDGVLDASDAGYSDFVVWQDKNQNGRSSANELMSLDEAGITSISLDLQSTGNNIDDYADNVVLNTADYTRADGTTGTTYDVALATSVIQNGRESRNSRIGVSDDAMSGQLGRISVSRIDKLLESLGLKSQSSNDIVTPIVLDINRDGMLDLVHMDVSGIEIDANDDGDLDRMGWVGATDGILALDRNGDGTITAVSEISFTQDLAGAQTDLEGLKAFDSNNDGYLDGSDARFGEFMVWQDGNQDGVSQSGELMSLEEAGMTRINLEAHIGRSESSQDNDNVVFGQTEVTYADGSTGIAGDVGLRVEFAENDLGFAGMAHVHMDSALKLEALATQSSWGKLVGRRSPLLAKLYAANNEQARLEALGVDTGMTQDELLAEFDGSDDATDIASSGGSVIDPKDGGPGYIKTGLSSSPTTGPKDDGPGYIKTGPTSDPKDQGPGYIKTGPTSGPLTDMVVDGIDKGAGPGYIKTGPSLSPITGPKGDGPGYIKTGPTNGSSPEIGAALSLQLSDNSLISASIGDDVSGISAAVLEDAAAAFRSYWSANGSQDSLHEDIGDGMDSYRAFGASPLDRSRVNDVFQSAWMSHAGNDVLGASVSDQAGIGDVVDASIATSLDLFNQAMAGFGAQSSIEGFKPKTDETDMFESRLASSTSWLNNRSVGVP